MLPSIISQFVTVIKDTSFLYSVIALQELFGKSQILMGGYYEPSQIFTLYGIVALAYFVINFAISSYSRFHLSKQWEQASGINKKLTYGWVFVFLDTKTTPIGSFVSINSPLLSLNNNLG